MLKEQILKEFPGLEEMLDAIPGLSLQFSPVLREMSHEELISLYAILLSHNERMELSEGGYKQNKEKFEEEIAELGKFISQMP